MEGLKNQSSQSSLRKSVAPVRKRSPEQQRQSQNTKKFRTKSCSPNIKTQFDTPKRPDKLFAANSVTANNNQKFLAWQALNIEPIFEKRYLQNQQRQQQAVALRSEERNAAVKKDGPSGGGGGVVKKCKKSESKPRLKLTQLKDIKPLNLEDQKIVFFERQGAYNPQFTYAATDLQFTIQKPHTKYLAQAVKILDTIVHDYSSDENFELVEGGQKITQEETELFFSNYIKDLALEDFVSFEFQENTVAPTSCIHSNQEGTSRVVISLPIRYRRLRIMGVLNHEIGTHIIRKYNDKLQRWHKHRKKYDLQDYSKIEEGLACINQHYETALNPERRPLLYKAALHYFASVMAAQMSFSELFVRLAQYQVNADERWKTCVRVKRGIADTSQKIGQYKDQIYLRGAIKVLKHRQKLNFLNLHASKITVKDCLRLTEKNLINTNALKVPYFLVDLDRYRQALDRIAAENFLE